MLSQNDIVYEDNHLLAVNKRAGWLVQGDITGDVALVEMARGYLRTRYSKKGNVYLGLVHRIDRPVSGVVVFAKTSKAAGRLSQMFHDRGVEKTYLAVVERRPRAAAGTLRHFLEKDEAENVVRAFDAPGEGRKLAELHYEVVAEASRLCLLKVRPRTGRPHQIRVQLASIGCPIAGDTKYGAKGPGPAVVHGGGLHGGRAIALLAYRVDFVHPVRKAPITIRARRPEGTPWSLFESALASFETEEGS